MLETNIAHSTASTQLLRCVPATAIPTWARRVMEEHCDDTAALLRGLLG